MYAISLHADGFRMFFLERIGKTVEESLACLDNLYRGVFGLLGLAHLWMYHDRFLTIVEASHFIAQIVCSTIPIHSIRELLQIVLFLFEQGRYSAVGSISFLHIFARSLIDGDNRLGIAINQTDGQNQYDGNYTIANGDFERDVVMKHNSDVTCFRMLR